MAPWARILVIIKNIIDRKYPLQHSRNLYYHLHKIIPTTLSQTIISSQLENKDSTAIQNTSDISNTDDINSYVTTRKKKLQCSGHIYNHLFETIDHYFTSCTSSVNKNNRITPSWQRMFFFGLTANLLMLINVSNQGY